MGCERKDDGREPCNIEQRWEYARIAIGMVTTPSNPIEYRNGDKNQNATHPSVRQPDEPTDSKLREQDIPDATHQCILVKQEEPEQERWNKAQAIEPSPLAQAER